MVNSLKGYFETISFRTEGWQIITFINIRDHLKMMNLMVGEFLLKPMCLLLDNSRTVFRMVKVMLSILRNQQTSLENEHWLKENLILDWWIKGNTMFMVYWRWNEKIEMNLHRLLKEQLVHLNLMEKGDTGLKMEVLSIEENLSTHSFMVKGLWN